MKSLTNWRDNRKKEEKINEPKEKSREMDKKSNDLNRDIDRQE